MLLCSCYYASTTTRKCELNQVVIKKVLRVGGEPPLETPEFFRHFSLNSQINQSIILSTLHKYCSYAALKKGRDYK